LIRRAGVLDETISSSPAAMKPRFHLGGTADDGVARFRELHGRGRRAPAEFMERDGFVLQCLELGYMYERIAEQLHLVALDGAYHEQGSELAWQALGHLKTSEVGEVLERAVRRMEKHLRRRSLLLEDDGADSGAEGDADPESNLAASAVSGQAPPAGPQWMRGLKPLEPHALAYDKTLCASLDGFTLHAATRAGALDQAGPRGALALRAASAGRAGARGSSP
jgi:hypothetical protein